MAIEYDLYIASDIVPDDLLRIVEDSLGLDHFRSPEFQVAHNPSLVGRSAPGFLLTAHVTNPMSAEIREEWLGFRPKVSVGFRMRKNVEERLRGYHSMLRSVSAVLTHLPDDAALIFNGETGILIRRDGRVVVSDEVRTFHADALPEIQVPYEFGRVPTAGDAPGP